MLLKSESIGSVIQIQNTLPLYTFVNVLHQKNPIKFTLYDQRENRILRRNFY